jgi:nicotinate-nucleotide adenylyltransferase
MKKVALYGGAFDPIHNGHLDVINSIFSLNYFNEIVLMPSCSKKNPLKKLTEDKVRLQMINRVDFDSNVKVSTLEIDNGLVRTYETIEKMKSDEIDLHIVVGLDNANNIEKWAKWNRLIEDYKFVIVKRPNEEINNFSWYFYWPHIILDVETTNISSSEIRKSIKMGNLDLVKKYLPEKVLEYILNAELYLE